MATSFNDAKTTLDDLSQIILGQKRQLQKAKAMITDSVNTLSGLPTTYGSIITYINTQAAANPSDPAWQNTKAEKDLIVAAYQALNTTATAMQTDLSNDDVS